MNANTIFLIIQVLIFCLLISCLIVGDTYITYMIFNASSYICERFTDITTLVSTATGTTTDPNTTTPSTTTPNTTIPSTTAVPTKQASQYSTCYDLTDTQLGFVRFKIVVFWILFLYMTGGAMYMIAKLFSQNQSLFGIIIAITLIISIFIIVGGAFMTQYGFTGGHKTCFMPTENPTAPQYKTTKYCFILNETELHFAKIAVVFGWIYSFAAIITIGLFLWNVNLG